MPPARPLPSPPLGWRDRAFLNVQDAAAIVGVSPASLYRFAGEGRLELRRFAGRTVVVAASLAVLVDGAEPWSPSGRAARATRARSGQAKPND